ncbi:pyridoxamine 5'-phosphate oxidase family protein [Cryptosporangium minutisporangium]|uniref:Pyridoxamine 5'-phosphate oxidase family protein n=1 Tax=Cryptosporangium minutisporangium TaxID=113569 RepID=A0ABP6T8I9_9ACTN
MDTSADLARTVIDRDACLRLLAGHRVGRVLFTAAAMPAALPVGYVLDGEAVVFRAAPGSSLARGAHGRVIGIQADEIDPETAAGWTVLGLGEAYEITDVDQLAGLAQRAPRWSAGGLRLRTLCIPLQCLTGSYLGGADVGPPLTAEETP